MCVIQRTLLRHPVLDEGSRLGGCLLKWCEMKPLGLTLWGRMAFREVSRVGTLGVLSPGVTLSWSAVAPKADQHLLPRSGGGHSRGPAADPTGGSRAPCAFPLSALQTPAGLGTRPRSPETRLSLWECEVANGHIYSPGQMRAARLSGLFHKAYSLCFFPGNFL